MPRLRRKWRCRWLWSAKPVAAAVAAIVRPLKQAAGGSDAVGDVQRVRWQACLLAEEADKAELADAGGGGELFEADVALRPITEILIGCAKRLVVTRAKRRSLRADGIRALEQRMQPLNQLLVALKSRCGGHQRSVQSHEVAYEGRS